MRWEKGEACWKTWGGIVEWLDELGWLAEELDGVENLLKDFEWNFSIFVNNPNGSVV